MQTAYLLEAVQPLIRIPKQLTPKLTLHLIYFSLRQNRYRHRRLQYNTLLLHVGWIVGVDEGVVTAEVGEVACALLVDVLVYAGENAEYVRCVSLVIVDDMVLLLNDFEEMCYFRDDVFVQSLFDLV
jgi:hypothetical protein